MRQVAINTPGRLKSVFSKGLSKTFIMQVVYFSMGLLSSRGAVLGEYSPFGTAFIAAVPYSCMLSSLAGAVIGYILPSSINASMRYIASIIAVAAIRWTLNDLKRISSHPLFAPIIAFLPAIATGLAIASVDDFETSIVMLVILESCLSAAGAYFFYKTIKFSVNRHGITGFSQEEFACLAMTICITILSFANLYIKGVSIGRILAVIIILLCARCAGVAGGSIAGIASGIVFSISSASLSYVSGAYAFSGMMGGLFSSLGNFATVISFALSNIIVTFETGDYTKVVQAVYEVVIASTIFMLIPQRYSDKFTQLLLKKSEAIKIDGLRKSITMRLDYVSKAMAEVSSSVESVSKKLEIVNISNIKDVSTKAINYTCRGCGLKIFCWDQDYEYSMSCFAEMSDRLKANGRIEESDFKKSFSDRCCKYPEMVRSINKYYDEFVIKESAQRRMGEIRGVISEQFLGMSGILDDIKMEFRDYEKFNDTLSQNLMSRLKQLDIVPIDVSCRENKFGRMFVEIETLNQDKRRLNKAVLEREISDICNKTMSNASISYAEDRCRIQISERPILKIEIGSAQHIFKDGKLCGDSYTYFDDGMGRKIIVISDGMGTGGRAAIDGAMTTGIVSKLSKAGLGFDSSLKIINSALLIKSGDESLATLDIACIDMFTGKASLLKAGASATFVRKGGRIICINTPSLPIGILTNVEFSSTEVILEDGDWLLMVSDGAVSSGEKWIETELKNYQNDSAEDLAQHIINMAMSRRIEDHDDDITAIAIRILLEED